MQKLIAALDLETAVTMTGRVTDGELGAYYQGADVLVSMSEHEGVGIPLLEAMHYGLAVVAYGAAAVPETVAGAGVLLNRKKPAVVAAAVHQVLSDSALRTQLVNGGKARVQDFTKAKAVEKLLAVVSPPMSV